MPALVWLLSFWGRGSVRRAGVVHGVRVLTGAYSWAVGRRLQIAVDCADPELVAAFWIEALSYRMVDPPAGYASWAEFSATEAHEPGEEWRLICDADGAGPTVLFHRVDEAKTVKNRIHLDVWVPRDADAGHARDMVEADVARLIDLGATLVRTRDDDGDFYVVMQDPEGNEFCIA
jgi:catechol 2,3-dioxygenase-like lactoylglutathione lyase family enzyme